MALAEAKAVFATSVSSVLLHTRCFVEPTESRDRLHPGNWFDVTNFRSWPEGVVDDELSLNSNHIGGVRAMTSVTSGRRRICGPGVILV